MAGEIDASRQLAELFGMVYGADVAAFRRELFEQQVGMEKLVLDLVVHGTANDLYWEAARLLDRTGGATPGQFLQMLKRNPKLAATIAHAAEVALPNAADVAAIRQHAAVLAAWQGHQEGSPADPLLAVQLTWFLRGVRTRAAIWVRSGRLRAGVSVLRRFDLASKVLGTHPDEDARRLIDNIWTEFDSYLTGSFLTDTASDLDASDRAAHDVDIVTVRAAPLDVLTTSLNAGEPLDHVLMRLSEALDEWILLRESFRRNLRTLWEAQIRPLYQSLGDRRLGVHRTRDLAERLDKVRDEALDWVLDEVVYPELQLPQRLAEDLRPVLARLIEGRRIQILAAERLAWRESRSADLQAQVTALESQLRASRKVGAALFAGMAVVGALLACLVWQRAELFELRVAQDEASLQRHINLPYPPVHPSLSPAARPAP